MTLSDPSLLLATATGFMAAQALFEASRIGLFVALGAGPAGPEALAAATGRPLRTVRLLAAAMAAQGLLSVGPDGYALTAESRDYLTGADSALDMGPYLAFLQAISYPHWLQFPATVDSDQPGDLGMTPARWETFLAGVMRYNDLHAAMLVQGVDLTGHRRALDLGGLSPSFAIRAMQANPALSVHFAYAPDYLPAIRQALDTAGLTARASLEGAATPEARPKGPYDLVFLNHLIHRFTPAQNRAILANARAAAAPGARLVVLDFYLDAQGPSRALDALHAGEYLVIDGTVVFPEAEVRGWLAETGWQSGDLVALPGSPRALLATAG